MTVGAPLVGGHGRAQGPPLRLTGGNAIVGAPLFVATKGNHKGCPYVTKAMNVVVPANGAFSFDALLQWIHPASREWQPLRPKLVVEVGYDHFSGGRFRHGTALKRFRRDKAPHQCTMDQLKQKRANLMRLLERA